MELAISARFVGDSPHSAPMAATIKLEGGKHYDIVAMDALWVPKYYQEGLIEPIDLQSWPAYQDLFDQFKVLST